jgi:Tfp pilus assembly protein PilX
MASSLRIGRLLRRLRDERGIALVMALGIMIVLAITAGAAMQYATSNSSESSASASRQKAFNLAEAGLNTALAVLYKVNNPTDPTAVPAAPPQNLEGGTSSYTATLAGTTWTLTGIGTVPNPAGQGSVTRTVAQEITVGSTDGSAWQYVFSDNASACMDIKNNADIAAPLYVRGDLCLGNGSNLLGSPIQVLGTMTMGNGSSVGFPGSPIEEAHIKMGCIKSGNPHACTSADGVYANILDSNPATITKPTVDLPYWYANAAPGPSRPCTTGSLPSGSNFDNGGGLNRSNPTFTLGSGPAFDCRVTDGSGNLIGRLAWTPGSPGTLAVAGTIFFDGDLSLSSLVYQGRATIYSSGVISTSNTSFCGVPACDATWNPSANAILLVAGSSTDPIGFDIKNNSVYQGAAYVVTGYSMKNNNTNWGPVIADTVDIKNNSGAFIPLNFLPPGAPGMGDTIKSVPGSWGG